MGLIIDITENLKKGRVKIHEEWMGSRHIDWFVNNNLKFDFLFQHY